MNQFVRTLAFFALVGAATGAWVSLTLVPPEAEPVLLAVGHVAALATGAVAGVFAARAGGWPLRAAIGGGAGVAAFMAFALAAILGRFAVVSLIMLGRDVGDMLVAAPLALVSGAATALLASGPSTADHKGDEDDLTAAPLP